MNTACNDKLPVLFHIQDNGYAISVPVEVSRGRIHLEALHGLSQFLILEFDGCDPEASIENWSELPSMPARARPVLLHAHVTPYSHSMSDDERLYRTRLSLQQAEADPITVYKRELLQEHSMDVNVVSALEESVRAELAVAKDSAQRRLRKQRLRQTLFSRLM